MLGKPKRSDAQMMLHDKLPIAVLAVAWTVASLFVTMAHAQEIACASADAIFCAGFEEGNFAKWDDYDDNSAPWTSLQAALGPEGLLPNNVLRLRAPQGRGGADLVKILPARADRVYLRWYQKWEQGYDFSAANHGSGVYAGDRNLLGRSGYRPSGSDFFSVSMEPMNGRLSLYAYYRGMYQDCGNPNGSCWGDHFPCFLDEGTGYCKNPAHREKVMPPSLETGRWYCLELMLDAGDPVSVQSVANGQLNMWIDGVEYGPWQQLWFRTTASLQTSVLWLSLFHHANHSAEGVMLDNVVVSRSPIGCNLSDARVPKAPTDVTVN